MHSSEFLKYAYELGAAQALADFEKEANLAAYWKAIEAASKNVWHNPKTQAGLFGAIEGIGTAPTSPASAAIGASLGALKRVAPLALPKRAVGPAQSFLTAANIAA